MLKLLPAYEGDAKVLAQMATVTGQNADRLFRELMRDALRRAARTMGTSYTALLKAANADQNKSTVRLSPLFSSTPTNENKVDRSSHPRE